LCGQCVSSPQVRGRVATLPSCLAAKEAAAPTECTLGQHENSQSADMQESRFFEEWYNTFRRPVPDAV